MKQIIWSNDSFMDDEAREYYQDCQREYLEDDGYTVSDEEWGEEVYRWLDDERRNLNVQVDGVIIAFGDLGLWQGRRQGYQILGSNIADIVQFLRGLRMVRRQLQHPWVYGSPRWHELCALPGSEKPGRCRTNSRQDLQL